MPYAFLKKYRFYLCLLLYPLSSFVVYAEPVFPRYSTLNTTLSDDPTLLWIIIYAGVLLALLVYNLSLFFIIRTISYLYYALLTGAILLAYGSSNDLWFTVLWSQSPKWHTLSLPIGLALSGIFSIAFCRSILSLSSYTPKLDTFLYRLSLLFALVLITSPFIPATYLLYGLAGLILIVGCVILLACIQPCLQGDRSAQFLFVSWLILLIGISLTLSHYFRWISLSWLAHYALAFTVLIYVLLHSFALSYRMIITRSQTLRFHQKLLADSKAKVIEQVKERTTELSDLNEQLRKQEDVLKKLAFYDSLTGLANRVFIQEQLKQLLAQSRRNKSKVSVLFLDLDDFKPINDEHGSKVGDEVLTIIAKRLQATLRESDVVGRLGCDKFLVLLESLGEHSHDPSEVADKIRAAIAQSISMDWFILNIDTSIGIAHYPNDGKDAASLIAAADSAMQANKAKKKQAKLNTK